MFFDSIGLPKIQRVDPYEIIHGQRTPRESFFSKIRNFGLGQTNWAEILGGILGISSQTIGTILAL